MRNLYTTVCLTLCTFVLVTIVEEFYRGAAVRRKSKGEGWSVALANLILRNKRRYGGYVVHLSMVVIFAGLSGNAFNRQSTRQLGVGEEMTIGEYTLRVTGLDEGDTVTYHYGRVVVQAFKNGKFVRNLKPEKRIFESGEQQSTTTVALYSTPKEDLYVVFVGLSDDGSKYEIMAHLNPLVFWVWLGAAIMVCGGIITLLPDRMAQSTAGQAHLDASEAAGGDRNRQEVAAEFQAPGE